MPRWGRPPGVRNGKQARRRATQWEDFDGVRFEEIDGDDDDDDAVLGSLQRHGTKGNNNTSSTREVRLRNDDGYDYDSELSDGEDFDLNDDADSTVAFAVQLAMRDKEDMLVEKALERIRRAQMLGKKNVRLSQEELDALDRRRKQAASSKKVPLSKATGFTRPLDGKRRKSGELAKTSSQAERRRSSQEQYLLDESSIAYAKAPSGAFHAAPNNRPSSSSSRPRTPTMQSLRPQSSANSPLTMHPHQPAYGQRYPDRDPLQPASPRDAPYIRALPDDPQWAPRQRSSSNATPYPVDNFMYGQPYGLGPGDPRLNYNGRRYAPTSMPYNGSGYPPVSEEPRRGSSGRQTRAESSEEESSSDDEDEDEEEDSEEEEDDDDGEHGVQVAVVEQPPIRKPAARTTAAQNKNNNNNNTRPRRRNGR
jgi:hypothetical protein